MQGLFLFSLDLTECCHFFHTVPGKYKLCSIGFGLSSEPDEKTMFCNVCLFQLIFGLHGPKNQINIAKPGIFVRFCLSYSGFYCCRPKPYHGVRKWHPYVEQDRSGQPSKALGKVPQHSQILPGVFFSSNFVVPCSTEAFKIVRIPEPGPIHGC